MARRAWGAVLVAATLSLVLTGCTPDGEPLPDKSTGTPAQPTTLRIAVSGPDKLTDAYRDIVRQFAAARNAPTKVIVDTYHDDTELMAALRLAQGTPAMPDLFLADQEDLPKLLARKLTQPVNGLLAARNIDTGDAYERAGLEAFSKEDALQCMPVQVSPLVVYYNSTLIDLSTVRPDRPIDAATGWRFEDFQAAAAQAAQTKGAKGVYVEPSLIQIAPFVYSGGGKLVDDEDEPTQLSLSDKKSQTALTTLLEVVRDPQLTFTEAQIDRLNARTRFEQGHLGMILGYRDDAREFYDALGNHLGVMPMPRIKTGSTVAKIQGLCLAAGLSTSDGKRAAAADLLANMISADASEKLAATGLLTPASTVALHSDAFLDSIGGIEGSQIFATLNRTIDPIPEALHWDRVQRRAAPRLTRMFYDTMIESLDQRLKRMDERSLTWFGVVKPSESPSPSPSSSPSDAS